uniref:Uncharacterized protein n=1 Tax=Tanacetum cinerariifolium TaxID=118510 RepID=A0A6L2LKI3_TANCI|nr:hypothetical protein [Tanacetum cinerariifolium]
MCEPSASSCMRSKRSPQRNRPGSQVQPESNARNVTRRVVPNRSDTVVRNTDTTVTLNSTNIWIRRWGKKLKGLCVYDIAYGLAQNKLNLNSPRVKIKEKKAK